MRQIERIQNHTLKFGPLHREVGEQEHPKR